MVWFKQAVGGRPPRYALAPLLPRGRRSVSRSRADGNRVSTANTFPRPPLQLPDVPKRRWVKRPGDLDLWPFDLESGVLVTCDVGYLCANFGLPRPLYSRLRPDVRDRQTDVRPAPDAHHRLMPRLLGAGHNKEWVNERRRFETYRNLKTDFLYQSWIIRIHGPDYDPAHCRKLIISSLFHSYR